MDTKYWTDQYATTFQTLLEGRKQESSLPVANWRRGGRVSKDKPNAEDHAFWMTEGPKQVENYIAWREANPEWRIWIAPDDRPAVELDLISYFGPVPIKLVIDRVFETPKGLAVTDLKTGTREPESDLQLGIYACALELAYGIRPDYGTYYMSRKGITTNPIDLTRYTVRYLSKIFLDFERALEAGIFIPNIGSHCRQCGVRRACASVGGKDAVHHDNLHPEFRA